MVRYKFLLFFSGYLSQSLPEIHGAACIVKSDELYVIGGVSGISNLRNPFIYSINLRELTRKKSPSWKKQTFDLDNSEYFLSSSELIGNFALVTVFSPQRSNFKIHELNIDKLSFTEKHSVVISKMDSFGLSFSHSLLNGITIIKSDINDNEYIIHSGGIKENNENTDSMFTYSYNSYSNKLTPLRYTTSYTFKNNFHSVAVYNGIMYVIGSYADSGPVFKLYGLDLANSIWKSYQVSGDVPEKQCGFSYTQKNNKLYATGGEYCNNNLFYSYGQNTVYILNLNSLVWTKYDIDNFEGYSQGCLVYYNNYLVHAFGYFNLKDPQVIDIRNWKLGSNKKGTFGEVETFDDKEASNNTTAIVSGLICTFLVMSIVCLIIWYIRRRRFNKMASLQKSAPPVYPIIHSPPPIEPEPITYPVYVTDPLWIQHHPNPQYYDLLSDTTCTLTNSNTNTELFELQAEPEFQSILGNYETYANAQRQTN